MISEHESTYTFGMAVANFKIAEKVNPKVTVAKTVFENAVGSNDAYLQNLKVVEAAT